jgi:hypothetical protein
MTESEMRIAIAAMTLERDMLRVALAYLTPLARDEDRQMAADLVVETIGRSRPPLPMGSAEEVIALSQVVAARTQVVLSDLRPRARLAVVGSSTGLPGGAS